MAKMKPNDCDDFNNKWSLTLEKRYTKTGYYYYSYYYYHY